MKKFSIAAITLLGMTVGASAQGTPPPAGKTPPAKADSKLDPKAGAPLTKQAEPKVEPKKPAEPAKPPQEVVDMAKAVVGTWKCKGSSMDTATMAMAEMTATMKTKADLDGFWIMDTFEAKMGKAKFKFSSYTTFDPGSKKWRRVMVDNEGGQGIGTSDGVKDGKATFNMDMMGAKGTALFRDHVDMTDLKAGMKASGEMSTDKGKTWNKVYEMTCRK